MEILLYLLVAAVAGLLGLGVGMCATYNHFQKKVFGGTLYINKENGEQEFFLALSEPIPDDAVIVQLDIIRGKRK